MQDVFIILELYIGECQFTFFLDINHIGAVDHDFRDAFVFEQRFERAETEGFMKVLVDANTKQILGAAELGIEGDEVMHTLLDLMYAKAPYTVVTRAMHVHPTVSEYLPSLFYSLEPLAP